MLALGVVLALLCAATASQAQEIWNITNGLVQVSVIVTSENVMWSVWGVNASCGPMPLPQISVNNEVVAWTNGVSVNKSVNSELQILNVVLSNSEYKIERIFQIYEGFPVVRTWGYVTSLQAITLSGAELLGLEMLNVGPAMTVFHVEQFSWAYGSNKYSQIEATISAGRIPFQVSMGSHGSQWAAPTSMGYFALDPLQSGAGFAVGIEFDGKSTLTLYNDAAAQIGFVASTIDDFTNHTMDVGEVFEWPGAFIGVYQGNWDDAGYVAQQFAEAHVFYPAPDDFYPYVQYDSWAYGIGLNESNQLAALDVAIELGLEVFVLDLGWAIRIGDWLQPDTSKFPNGLAPLVDKAHAAGLKFGLHLPYDEVDPQSQIALDHPDWIATEVIDYYGSYPLCLGNQPAQDYIVATIIKMIDTYNIDYIVQDGEDIVKFCPHTDHTHSYGDSNYANSQTGFDEVIARVREARPEIIIEGLADGGTFNTFKMTSLYTTANTVDNIDSYATRQGIFGATYVFSPRYTTRYLEDPISNYTLFSNVFGGPLIFMQQLSEWNSSTISIAKSAIDLFKTIRRSIRDGKVIHIQAPENHIDTGTGWGWDLIQSISTNGSQLVLQACRAYGGQGSFVAPISGVEPSASYDIMYASTGQTEVVEGTVLTSGLNVELEELSCEIVVMNKM